MLLSPCIFNVFLKSDCKDTHFQRDMKIFLALFSKKVDFC